jgi:hypothetical protein
MEGPFNINVSADKNTFTPKYLKQLDTDYTQVEVSTANNLQPIGKSGYFTTDGTYIYTTNDFTEGIKRFDLSDKSTYDKKTKITGGLDLYQLTETYNNRWNFINDLFDLGIIYAPENIEASFCQAGSLGIPSEAGFLSLRFKGLMGKDKNTYTELETQINFEYKTNEIFIKVTQPVNQ